MARQVLTITNAGSGYPTAGTLLVETAEDASNHSSFASTGKEIVIVHNTDAANNHNVTVHSSADPYGRSQDITTENVPAATQHIFFLAKQGWADSGGNVNVDGDNVAIKIGVIRLA